jgi:catechol-2,3-dioxygenase
MNFITILIMSILLVPQVSTKTSNFEKLESRTVQGAFFALSVADISVMKQWYQDNLGLKVLSSGEAPNQIAKFAILEGDGILIEMIQHSKAQSRKTAAPSVNDAVQIHGIFKIGLLVGDLDAVYTGLKKRNITIAYDLMRAKDVPMRSFSVRDPEGNLVQFFGK